MGQIEPVITKVYPKIKNGTVDWMRFYILTLQERKILFLTGVGLSIKETAEQLFL